MRACYWVYYIGYDWEGKRHFRVKGRKSKATGNKNWEAEETNSNRYDH